MEDLPAETHVKKLASIGALGLAGVTYMVSGQHGFHQVVVIVDGDNLTVTDVLIQHRLPCPETSRPRPPTP